MLSLSDNNQTYIIEAFNSTSRYFNALLNIDNIDTPYFELQLNKANSPDADTPFLDLNLSITTDIVSSKIMKKGDDFNFEIVNFYFLMEMFLSPLPMVYIILSLFVLLECVLMLMTSTTETYSNS